MKYIKSGIKHAKNCPQIIFVNLMRFLSSSSSFYSESLPTTWRRMFASTCVINILRDLGASIYTAFNHSGQFKLPDIHSYFLCAQLIKRLSSVVYNCLIRVLLIIVIKESSIHIGYGKNKHFLHFG